MKYGETDRSLLEARSAAKRANAEYGVLAVDVELQIAAVALFLAAPEG